MSRSRRSISLPITLMSIAVALSIALMVGWIIIVVRNQDLSERVTSNTWLLVAGIVSFGLIMAVLVVFAIALVRQILEVRRQDRFIDSVTHELKSPLASIKLCLETLPRRGLEPSQHERLRVMMLDDVERLTLLIDDVLVASRLEHDRVGHDVEQVDISELIDSCVTRVARRYEVEDDAVRLDVAEYLSMRTDRTALEIVLLNLVDNAIKYSDPPVQVTVRAWREGRRVGFEVTDQGIGIPRPQLGRIFQRFHRVPSRRVHARRGTGLGLYVVRALVDQLGGKLKADSEGSGMGSTFTVLLPHEMRSKAKDSTTDELVTEPLPAARSG